MNPYNYIIIYIYINIKIYDSYLFDPSWNTDQGVYCIRKSLSVKTYWHNESKDLFI